jgi:RHS repeat-associated protein
VLHQLGTTTLDGASYTYDLAGNRKTRTDKRLGTTLTYAYDNIYQLLTAKQGTTTKESYTGACPERYSSREAMRVSRRNPVGNRLSSVGVSPYQYNASNQLTSIPGTTYTYDNNGNTKTKTTAAGTTTYTWDFENRLTQVALPGTTGTVTFKYDPFGRRVQQAFTQGVTTTTTNYLYDGMNLLEEVDNSGSVLARYNQTRGLDEELSEFRGGATSYYEADGLGTITSLSNGAGALANTYSYDSYGRLTASTGTLTNPFQFTGREFDQETGSYYYRARYFDQNSGRFMSEDPIKFGGGINFYAYVHNNPTNLNDPFGLCDNNNCRVFISCGPTPRTQGFAHCTVTVQNGNNYTAYDGGPSGSIWWSQIIVGHGPTPGPPSNPVFNAPIADCDCVKKEADAINSQHWVYNFMFQNSNTAAWMMTANCGYNARF